MRSLLSNPSIMKLFRDVRLRVHHEGRRWTEGAAPSPLSRGPGAPRRAFVRPGSDLCQLDEVAPVQRQRLHQLFGDHVLESGSVGLEDGRLPCDLHRLGDLANLQQGVDANSVTNREIHWGRHERLVALPLDGDRVRSRGKQGEHVFPPRVRLSGSDLLCPQVGGLDRRAGDGPGLVGHGPQDVARDQLGAGGRRVEEARAHQREQRMPDGATHEPRGAEELSPATAHCASHGRSLPRSKTLSLDSGGARATTRSRARRGLLRHPSVLGCPGRHAPRRLGAASAGAQA